MLVPIFSYYCQPRTCRYLPPPHMLIRIPCMHATPHLPLSSIRQLISSFRFVSRLFSSISRFFCFEFAFVVVYLILLRRYSIRIILSESTATNPITTTQGWPLSQSKQKETTTKNKNKLFRCIQNHVVLPAYIHASCTLKEPCSPLPKQIIQLRIFYPLPTYYCLLACFFQPESCVLCYSASCMS